MPTRAFPLAILVFLYLLGLVLFLVARFLISGTSRVRTIGVRGAASAAPGGALLHAGATMVFLVNIAVFFLSLSLALSGEPRLLFIRLPFPAAVIGIVLAASGLAFGAWAMAHNRRYRPMYRAMPSEYSIVVSGPYSIVRHPRYAAEMLLNCAFFLSTGCILPLAGLLFWPFLVLQAGREEGLLEKTGGEEYARYRGRVKRAFPFAVLVPLAALTLLAASFFVAGGAARHAQLQSLFSRSVASCRTNDNSALVTEWENFIDSGLELEDFIAFVGGKRPGFESLRRLDACVFSTAHPEFMDYLGALIASNAGASLAIRLDGKTWPPDAVYYGTMKERFRIGYAGGDDAIHLTEITSAFREVGPDARLEFTAPAGYVPVTGFYTGEPPLMHATGYDRVRKARYEKGLIKLEGLAADTDHLLFAVFSNTVDGDFYKSVWILRIKE